MVKWSLQYSRRSPSALLSHEDLLVLIIGSRYGGFVSQGSIIAVLLMVAVVSGRPGAGAIQGTQS